MPTIVVAIHPLPRVRRSSSLNGVVSHCPCREAELSDLDPLDRIDIQSLIWVVGDYDIANLGGLAEFERELIRARTGEGRERAKARGVRLGRKPKLNPHQRREALARRATGEPLTEIARTYAVSHSTISRLR